VRTACGDSMWGQPPSAVRSSAARLGPDHCHYSFFLIGKHFFSIERQDLSDYVRAVECRRFFTGRSRL